MTTQEPADSHDALVGVFADSGVALVCIPHIGGSFLHGASFYDGERIVMGLTLRGKDADKFWFSLFHELCHVLRGHISVQDEPLNEFEHEADAFARDVLIPPDEYKGFVGKNTFSREAIEAFAAYIHITPGIVLGRLQKDDHLPYDHYNELKGKAGEAV
jgi:HTH-type transcriptional regulator/antitoxin HigA